jgi:hypothetical protein
MVPVHTNVLAVTYFIINNEAQQLKRNFRTVRTILPLTLETVLKVQPVASNQGYRSSDAPDTIMQAPVSMGKHKHF